MKKLLNFSLAVMATMLFSAQAYSQGHFGVKAGLNYATIQAPESENVKGLVGPQLGIVYYSSLDNALFFQTGLLYNTKGAKISGDFSDDDDDFDLDLGDISLKYEFIELPVNVGFQIPIAGSMKLAPYVGGFAGYAFKGTMKFGGMSFDMFDKELNEDVKLKDRLDYGANLGLGLHFNNHFIISAQYSHGLSNMGSDEDVGTRTFTAGISYVF